MDEFAPFPFFDAARRNPSSGLAPTYFFSFLATMIRAQVSKFHRIRWIIQLSCERPCSAFAGPCYSSVVRTSGIETRVLSLLPNQKWPEAGGRQTRVQIGSKDRPKNEWGKKVNEKRLIASRSMC